MTKPSFSTFFLICLFSSGSGFADSSTSISSEFKMPSSSSSFSPSLRSPSLGAIPSGESNAANGTHELPLPPPPISSACAACKYQRRKCGSQCMLAPYFPPERQQEFQNAHRLFGVSNIVKKLRRLSPADRQKAVDSMVFEANMHATDPSGGCLRFILELENKLTILQAELSVVKNHLAFYRGGGGGGGEPCNVQINPHEQPYAGTAGPGLDAGPYIINTEERSNFYKIIVPVLPQLNNLKSELKTIKMNRMTLFYNTSYVCTFENHKIWGSFCIKSKCGSFHVYRIV